MKHARSIVAAFLAGALFTTGLALGGMTQPSKVVGFLDFVGAWDPSLVFVMGGAVTVYAVVHRLVRRRPRPAFDSTFHLATRTDVDARLLAGAAIFGAGWGLAGYCPGPGLASLASGSFAPIAFVLAMSAGMVVQRKVDGVLARHKSAPDLEPTALPRRLS